MDWPSSATGDRAVPSGVKLAGGSMSALPPRDTNALVRAVADRLRSAVALEEIPSGTRLNQVEVASQLGVSRMPVRTAIADLTAEGLLEPMAGGGVAVRSLTERDVREVYEVRAAMETQAARHVAQQQPPVGLETISQVLGKHAELEGANDPPALLELDREFHMAILEATGNVYFRRSMVPIWSVVERAMVGMLRTVPDMFERAWVQHAEITEALRAGEAELAETRVRQHLEFAAGQFTAVMAGGEEAAGNAT